MTKWHWIWRQLTGQLWLRAGVFTMIGIASALAGALMSSLIPESAAYKIDASAIDDILNIIASSMLAVTIFSLSVMVAAYSSAANSATPRAISLLLADNTSQNALSTFIGAFLFSIVGLLASKAGIYGDEGLLILYVITVLVIVFVVLTLLNWIEYLSRLGRMRQTVDMVERAAGESIEIFCKQPFLGGVPFLFPLEFDERYLPVRHPRIGYVHYIDAGLLNRIAESLEKPIYLAVRTGGFNDSVRPLVYVEAGNDEAERASLCERIQSAFSIGSERRFEQDPRYGIIVLTEIAIHSIPGGSSESGTAIDILGSLVRTLAPIARLRANDIGEPIYSHLQVPPIAMGDFFEDSFISIARASGSVLEVSIRLQKALVSLGKMGDDSFQKKIDDLALYALSHTLEKLPIEQDREKIRQVVLDLHPQFAALDIMTSRAEDAPAPQAAELSTKV